MQSAPNGTKSGNTASVIQRKKPLLPPKLAAEVVGTFFLVSAYLHLKGMYMPFGIGLVLVGMVYTAQPFSGAHFNPALSFAVWIRGKLDLDRVWPFILAQFFGTALAIGVWYVLHDLEPVSTAIDPEFHKMMLAEALGTFALTYAFLHLTTPEGGNGIPASGVALGLTLSGLIIIFARYSGAQFNPAVTISHLCIGKLGILWVPAYIFFQLIAAAGGAYCFAYVSEARDKSKARSANDA